MKFVAIIFITLQFLNICNVSVAWDDDELEVFDVVEEVNQNFYQLLGLTQVNFYLSFKNKYLIFILFNIYLFLIQGCQCDEYQESLSAIIATTAS